MVALAVVVALASPLAMAQSTPSADQTTQGAGAQPPADEPTMLFHLAGYADATYVDSQGEAGSSGQITLAPIFHLQLADRVFVETELELEANDRGKTETAVEYATVSWLINDHVALVVGKFLSPVGYFVQNAHPSWINKLASAPAGFGHGGAAPLSDVGVQLRGGKTFPSGQHVNYAVYLGNGPRLGAEGTHVDDLDLDLNVAGSTHNRDGKRVAGGRLGWMPIANLELGASLARGEVVLDAGDFSELPEPPRRYQVAGLDAAWRPISALELRGEWIRQRVGDAPGSVVPAQATWRAWYAQGTYRFGAERWETVLRFGDSVSPHGESTFKQTAIGLNYLLRPNAIVKLSWEFNDSADADANRLLLQFAYGL